MAAGRSSSTRIDSPASAQRTREGIHVSGLYTYPIKSCSALTHDQFTLDARGPAWDRRWMVVTPDGRFVSQREWPRLAVVQPFLGTDALELRAPGQGEVRIPLRRAGGEIRRVRVWDDECEAWDEGEDAARLFSEHLGTSVRLVRMADAFVRAVEGGSARPAQTGFADAFPLLVLSEASLEELNRRLVDRGGSPVPMGRFRPNLVLAGGPAFAEDEWKAIRVGAITLDLVKACARCVTTTVDQARGEVPDPREPLATLATFRRRDDGVVFGQNAVHREPGLLSVGDRVTPVERI